MDKDRRSFLSIAGAAGGSLALAARSGAAPAKLWQRSSVKTALIHVTDLYRPHNDPDDHYDLATAFALAANGSLELAGVLLENPINFRSARRQSAGDAAKSLDRFIADDLNPDIASVAQLNYMTGLSVPTAVGLPWPKSEPGKLSKHDLPRSLGGVGLILDILRAAKQPIAINIVGSCQDIAIAGALDPQLFREKCSAIYLAAGTGSNALSDQTADGGPEWNVNLNPSAYAMVFDIPCPIYWLPCVYSLSKPLSGAQGAFWRLPQKAVLPSLNLRLKNYFSYMLLRRAGIDWLSYLENPENAFRVDEFLWDDRGIYSTAAFLHAAGQCVTRDGTMVELEAGAADAAYEFVPIEVRCDERGFTSWRPANVTGAVSQRYIFKIRDRALYDASMLIALKTLFAQLV